MFERSGAGDDLVACPRCRCADRLRVRFHDHRDGTPNMRTEILCSGCGQAVAERESRWAYAEWNHWAAAGWGAIGEPVRGANLYALLKDEAHLQRSYQAREIELGTRIAYELANLVECPWEPGDRFSSDQTPGGLWEVEGIERIYATNTGPIWILRAISVRASGALGSRKGQFSSLEAGTMVRLAPYWRPSRWNQVVSGESCYYRGQLGQVVSTDSTARRASVLLSDGTIAVAKTLRELRVHVQQFRANST